MNQTTDQASEDTTRTLTDQQRLIEHLAALDGPSMSLAVSRLLLSTPSEEHRELVLRKLYMAMREQLEERNYVEADKISLIAQRLVQMKAFA